MNLIKNNLVKIIIMSGLLILVLVMGTLKYYLLSAIFLTILIILIYSFYSFSKKNKNINDTKLTSIMSRLDYNYNVYYDIMIKDIKYNCVIVSPYSIYIIDYVDGKGKVIGDEKSLYWYFNNQSIINPLSKLKKQKQHLIKELNIFDIETYCLIDKKLKLSFRNKYIFKDIDKLLIKIITNKIRVYSKQDIEDIRGKITYVKDDR